MRSTSILFSGTFALILCATAHSQDWQLSVTGEVKHPVTFAQADFATLPRRAVVVPDSKGRSVEYRGVPLFELLLRAGAPSGDSIHGKNLVLYLEAGARDGYKVVYALPEIDTLFTDRTILVADTKNGGPLDEKERPLEIIVPGEKKHTRWVRQLDSLTVIRSRL